MAKDIDPQDASATDEKPGNDPSIAFAMRGAAPGDDGLEARGMLAGLRAKMFGKSDARMQIGGFRVLRTLGSGGMGVVYEAYDPELQRHVAVKVLKDVHGHGQADLRREARAIAKLSHPHVIAVHEVGQDGDETFVAMEYVAGGDLAEWAQSPRTWQEVLEVYLQAGAGLAAAHGAGLVHGDFKPQNALRGAEDGRVRVLDFGLARSVGPRVVEILDERETLPDLLPANADQTLRSLDGGTPRYMAPEQYRGERATAASDQFSFAVALYETLYEAHPFVSATHDWSTPPDFSRPGEPPAHARVPQWIHRILTRALAIDPEQRWPDMQLLLAALADDPARKRRARWLTSGVAVSLAATIGGWQYAQELRQQACAVPVVARQLDGSWDGETRTALTQALQKDGPPFAQTAAQRTTRALDVYAEQWVGAKRDACEVRQARDSVPSRRHSLHEECLSQRRDELAAVAATLTAQGSSAAMQAVEAASSLPPIASCNSEAILTSAIDPLARTARADEIRGLRQALTRAWAQSRAGDFETPLPALRAALVQAKALGYEPVIAEAEYFLGEVLDITQAGRQQALGHYEAAISVGTRARHDRIVAIASASILVIFGRLDQPEAADRWIELARAAVDRYGRGGREEAYLENNIGVVLSERGQPGRALTHYQSSLALKSKIWGDNHIDVAKSLNNIAALDEGRGDYAAALDNYGQALERMQKSIGDHPAVGFTMANISNVRAILGELEEAETIGQRALAMLSAQLGQSHPWTGAPRMGLCRTFVGQGRDREALDMCARAHQQLATAFGATSMPAAEMSALQARAALRLGQLELAREAAQRGWDIVEAGERDATPQRAEILLTAAEMLAATAPALAPDDPRIVALARASRAGFEVAPHVWANALARSTQLIEAFERRSTASTRVSAKRRLGRR